MGVVMSYKHEIEKAPYSGQGLMNDSKLSNCEPIIQANNCLLQVKDRPFICNNCNYFLVSNTARLTKIY